MLSLLLDEEDEEDEEELLTVSRPIIPISYSIVPVEAVNRMFLVPAVTAKPSIAFEAQCIPEGPITRFADQFAAHGLEPPPTVRVCPPVVDLLRMTMPFIKIIVVVLSRL